MDSFTRLKKIDRMSSSWDLLKNTIRWVPTRYGSQYESADLTPVTLTLVVDGAPAIFQETYDVLRPHR